jgi:hypothetical protein
MPTLAGPTIAQQPATQGLRGALNGMGLKLAPTEEELAERREALRQEIAREEEARRADEQLAREEVVQETRRAARARAAAEKDRAERAIIQTNYDEPKTASFMNDKGGVGKTTDALCIAAAAGRIRGGDVIAWDANETRGTMGFRALKDRHSRSVVDFLQEAAEDFTTVEGSRRTTLTRYTRGQGDNKFSVLASDESRKKQDQVDGDAFRTVHEIVGRFHSLIIVDTGNNHEVSHFKAALAATDQLVIPVSPARTAPTPPNSCSTTSSAGATATSSRTPSCSSTTPLPSAATPAPSPRSSRTASARSFPSPSIPSSTPAARSTSTLCSPPPAPPTRPPPQPSPTDSQTPRRADHDHR